MGFINQLITGGHPNVKGPAKLISSLFSEQHHFCAVLGMSQKWKDLIVFFRCRGSILRWGVCGSVRCPTWGSDVLSPQIPRFKSLDPQLAVRSPGYEFTCCWRNRWKVLLIQKARDVAGVWQLCFTTLVTQNHPITSCQIGAYPIMNL